MDTRYMEPTQTTKIQQSLSSRLYCANEFILPLPSGRNNPVSLHFSRSGHFIIPPKEVQVLQGKVQVLAFAFLECELNSIRRNQFRSLRRVCWLNNDKAFLNKKKNKKQNKAFYTFLLLHIQGTWNYTSSIVSILHSPLLL